MEKLYHNFTHHIAKKIGISIDIVQKMVIFQPDPVPGPSKIIIPQNMMTQHKDVIEEWASQNEMWTEPELYHHLTRVQRPEKNNVVVIFLPCGAGFIHKDLAAALTTYKGEVA